MSCQELTLCGDLRLTHQCGPDIDGDSGVGTHASSSHTCYLQGVIGVGYQILDLHARNKKEVHTLE